MTTDALPQEVNKIRKLLYLKFKAWAGKLRAALTKRGHWGDASCPITGSCMFGERAATSHWHLFKKPAFDHGDALLSMTVASQESAPAQCTTSWRA